jgi:hypothetical protein
MVPFSHSLPLILPNVPTYSPQASPTFQFIIDDASGPRGAVVPACVCLVTGRESRDYTLPTFPTPIRTSLSTCNFKSPFYYSSFYPGGYFFFKVTRPPHSYRIPILATAKVFCLVEPGPRTFSRSIDSQQLSALFVKPHTSDPPEIWHTGYTCVWSMECAGELGLFDQLGEIHSRFRRFDTKDQRPGRVLCVFPESGILIQTGQLPYHHKAERMSLLYKLATSSQSHHQLFSVDTELFIYSSIKYEKECRERYGTFNGYSRPRIYHALSHGATSYE